jgi:hypothetical protein
MNRLLSKDFLSGAMFIAFGLVALWFGRNLALGTTVRMGPGYVPHMLANIMMILGCAISVISLFVSAAPRERETVWIPVGVAALAFIVVIRFLLPHLFTSPPAPLFVQMSNDWMLLIAVTGILAVFLAVILVSALGRVHAHAEGLVDLVEAPKWKPITMVTVGIVCFALLFETTGLVPALIAMVLIASLGGDEFKIVEVIANIVVLTILCILVFKVGLSMNVYVLRGVW